MLDDILDEDRILALKANIKRQVETLKISKEMYPSLVRDIELKLSVLEPILFELERSYV